MEYFCVKKWNKKWNNLRAISESLKALRQQALCLFLCEKGNAKRGYEKQSP